MRFETIPGGLRVHTPAKINLSLEVGPRRDDGFHDIDSVFQAVSLCDEIELRDAPAGEISLVESGIDDQEGNLVWRAADLLRRSGLCSQDAGGVRIRLEKRIPQGGGLGGGSSDAAATLLALRRLWRIPAGAEELLPLAAELGSDVPFFLQGGTARCTGRGEVVEPLDPAALGVEGQGFVLACPDVRVDTAGAYAALDQARDPNLSLTSPPRVARLPAAGRFLTGGLPAGGAESEDGMAGPGGDEEEGDALFFNRFESVVYPLFGSLAALRDRLRAEPFRQVLLSGSGSTIFGVCSSPADARVVAARLGPELNAEGGVATRVIAVEAVARWASR